MSPDHPLPAGVAGCTSSSLRTAWPVRVLLYVRVLVRASGIDINGQTGIIPMCTADGMSVSYAEHRLGLHSTSTS